MPIELPQKFKETKQRHAELEKQLADVSITSNQQKLKEISQEFYQLDDVVKKIGEYERILSALAEAQDTLISEPDGELAIIAEEEITSLSELKVKLENDVKMALVPKDPLDHKNIIIEIRAGTGGDEASLFASDLFRMYSRYAENKDWKTKILSESRSEVGGFKEIIFEVSGIDVYHNLKYESGVHRVQRVPETEKSGRVHTSAATIAVLPEAEEVDINIKTEDLRIDVFRAGGHGGQSVNTTDSAVRITHLPTNTVVSCQDEKSQQKNKDKAMKILRSRILAAESERIASERGEARKSQIGTGDRSEKIRTYNYPQDRITDHRIKKSWNNIVTIMDGGLQDIIDELISYDYQQFT